MYIHRSSDTNPFFNLATEDYLLKNFKHDICFVYQNSPSVIVGKHQNANAQINHAFIYKNNIDVIRRISGGGAVFHDNGNLNISIIKFTNSSKAIDFQSHTNIILSTLEHFKIFAQLRQKSNLFTNSLKISGNAAHISKKRVMHHGTLLFDSNLLELKKSLKTNATNYHDKAVKSQSARVINLTQLGLSSMDDFIEKLKKNLNCKNYHLNSKDIMAINKSVESKFTTIEWNFGYSPNYIFRKIIYSKAISEVYFKVEKGFILKISIKGSSKVIKQIEDVFLKKIHHWEVFSEIIEKEKFHQILGIDKKDFIQYFF